MSDEDELSPLDAINEVEQLLSPAKQKKLNIEERRQRVFELKVEGKTLMEIAKELKITYAQAQGDFAKATESIDTTRWLKSRIEGDVVYLDKLISAYSSRAFAGDVEATKVILALMARQHRILGMEAPKRVDVHMLIEQWAQREGLDASAVIDVVARLLPSGE